jgi:Na+-driven multidrug efflux pump
MFLPLKATFASFVIHLAALWVFVTWLEMGLIGASIATSLHMFLRWFITHLVIKNTEYLNEYY